MAHKLVEDSEKSFKIQRPDGQVVHIAKTPETMPIYKLCKGGAMPGYAQGGSFVPGKAQVAGDSPKNDTVSAKLSPGELVVPRSIVAQGPQAVAKFAAEALAGKHPAAPSQHLYKAGLEGGKESDDDSSDKKDDTPSKEDVSDALKTIATAAAGGKDDSKSSLPKFGLGADPEPTAGDPHDSALYKSDAPLAKLMTGRIDITGKPTGLGDSNGQMQVDGAPLQNAQTDYDQSGYSPTPSTDSSATAGPDTGGGQPATQDPSQAPGYNPMAGVPNAAPQQAQPGAPAPLEAAQNQAAPAPAVDPNAPATNVGAPDGTGHVPPGSTGGGGAGGIPMAQQMSKTTTSSYNPGAAQGARDVQAAGNAMVQADQAAAEKKNDIDQMRLQSEYDTLKEQNAKAAAFNQQRNNEIESRIAKMDAVQTKFAGMSIDSNRLYGDGQTGNKILAGIGLSLGAFGQGLAGGPNQALQAIDKAIDRDIEVQKANINKVGKEYEMARGGLKDYMDASKDMETSMVAEKARQLELVGKQYEQISAANANPMIKAQAAKTAYEVSQKVAALKEKVQTNTTTTVVSSMPMHQEAQLPDQIKDVHSNIAIQAKTEKMMSMLKDGLFDEAGPLDGRVAKAMDKYGMTGPEAHDFLADSKSITMGIVHELAGARGMAPGEFALMAGLGPDVQQSPATLMKTLQRLHQDASSKNDMIAYNNRTNHRFDYDLKGERAAYDRSNPEAYQRANNIRPASELNKRRN